MNRALLILGGISFIAAILLGSFRAAGPAPRDTDLSAAKSKISKKPTSESDSSSNFGVTHHPSALTAPAFVNDKAPAALPLNAPNDAILQEIEQASISYNAADLPRIRPFLSHPDPDIRAAAVNGMIILGEAAAAPMLREASRMALTPQETVQMLEAAAYLELPSGSLVSRTPDGRAVPRRSVQRPQSSNPASKAPDNNGSSPPSAPETGLRSANP